MGRRARNQMREVVAVLRRCDWRETDASALKALPLDGRPVSSWWTPDEELDDVIEGVRRALRAVRASLAA